MQADLYARKSNQDAGRSVERQERAWRSDCVAEGHTPGRVFVDPDLSASRYSKRARPDYGALLTHIEASGCEMISLWEGSRGSRQMGEWVAFLDLCRAQGVLIRIFGDLEDAQTFDPRRQRDREALMKEGMAAEAEIERLRSRTRAGTADAAQQGRPPGPLLDGYRRIYGAPTADSVSSSGNKRREIRQVIDEPRAQIYQWAAEGALNGVPMQYIARVLNAWQVPSPSGSGEWSGANLRRALLLPGMQGHRVLGGKVVAHNAWPAIIEPDVAAQLRAMSNTATPVRPRGDTSLKHLLSGAILCGACRRGLYGKPRASGGKYRYRCRYEGCQAVAGPMEQIDEVVSAMVIARLREPDASAVFSPVTDDAALRRAEADLQGLVNRRDELYAEAAKPKGPSMGLVVAAEQALLPQIEKATALVRELQTPSALRGYDPDDLAEHWHAGKYSVGERRAVVMALAEIVLARSQMGNVWSIRRLADSRWHGHARTWGHAWRAGGVVF